jgi:hypothetical protein
LISLIFYRYIDDEGEGDSINGKGNNDESQSCDITRTMCKRDSQGLSRLLDARILEVGDSLFLRLKTREEYDFFSTIWSENATLILQG